MNYTEAKPCPALARIVECYWFLDGEGSAPESRRVVPDGRTEIILNFGQPFAQYTSQGWRTQPAHFFAGQITRPLLLRPTGPFSITGVRLKPAGPRSLISAPISKMTDRIVPLEQLAPALVNLSPALLDATLNSHIMRTPDLRIEAAVNHLLATAGAASLAEVAGITGWSTRHLQRRFLEEVGISPRVFARMQRFQKVFRTIEENGGNWADAALECGYFDQGHLIRDFHELAGLAPTALTHPDAGLAEFFLQHRNPKAAAMRQPKRAGILN